MKKNAIVFVSLFVLTLAGCAPQVDIEAEKAAIEKTITDHAEATNQPGEEGAEGYASFVTEDAVWLAPNTKRIDGREGVRTFALPQTQSEEWSAGWRATSIEIAADGKLAYAIGTYEFSLKDAAGNPVSDKGKLVNILKKQTDGSWKIAAAIWNSNLPAGAE